MDAAVWNGIWPDWQFKNVIGRGAYGIVYRAVRFLDGKEEESAIKVISLPHDEMEIEQLRSEGMTEEETQNYFASLANEFYEEIQTMKALNGSVSIVNVQDSAIVPRQGEFGWNILIRMECLTPLVEYLDGRMLTEAEVTALGIDLCRALEVCEEHGILHRDIKPENIFVDKEGHFKLGDFGIAKQLEATTGAFTRVGTPFYSAPEVADGKRYDRRVDIYSLGLVIYRLLNNGKLPFMPEKRLLTPGDRRMALERRLNGETLPPPAEASGRLAQVILKACEPKAKDRYDSAAEFRAALENTRKASVLHWWKRSGVRVAGVILAAVLTGGAVYGLASGSLKGNRPVTVIPVETGSSSSEENAPVTLSEETAPPAGDSTADDTETSEADLTEELSVSETDTEAAETETEAETVPAETDTETEASSDSPTVPPATTAPEETTKAAVSQTTPAETTKAAVPQTTPAETTKETAAQTTPAATTPAQPTEHIHSFGSWTLTRDPTCTAAGERSRSCSCGEIQSESVAALGHSFGTWTTVTEVTCTEPGKQTRVCSRCGAAEEQPIEVLGHSFGSWTGVTEATCTKPGTEQRSCSRCGMFESQSVAALGHNMVDGICTRCGSSQFTFVLNGDGQSYTITGTNGTLDTSKKVVMPSYYNGLPVTQIRAGAFKSCNYSGGLQLPSNLTSIAESTFSGSTVAGTLVIPGSVKTIGTFAFNRLQVDTLILEEGVTTLESASFGSLRGRPAVTIPSTVSFIGSAFYMTANSSNFTRFSTLTINSQSALDNLNGFGTTTVETIILGAKITDYSVRNGCLIRNSTGTLLKVCESFTIPTDGSIKIIDGLPFFTNYAGASYIVPLYEVRIPEGVKKINLAAYSSTIQTVYLPHSLEFIIADSFSGGCPQSYVYAGTMAEWLDVTIQDIGKWKKPVYCTDGTLRYENGQWVKN